MSVAVSSEVVARDAAWESARWLGVAVLVVCAFVAFRFRNGADSPVLVHDNLDGEFVNQVVFARSSALLAGGAAVFEPLLGGMPRSFMPSELFLPMLAYRFLPPFAALVVLELFVRCAALVGMWQLLKHHTLPSRPAYFIAVLSLAFALLPFYPNYGLSVAGYPFVISAFLDLMNGRRARSACAVLAVYPLLVSFALSGIFVLAFGSALLLYALCASQAQVRSVLAGLSVFFASTLLVERRMFAAMIRGSIASQRTEFVPRRLPLSDALELAGENFIEGQYHADAAHFPLVLVLAFGVLVFVLAHPAARRGVLRSAAWLVACCAAISLWYGLWWWQGTRDLADMSGVRALRQINLARLHWMHPALWSLIAALALDQLRSRLRFGSVLALALATGQCALAVRANVVRVREKGAPFAAFFAEDLFRQVRAYIGKPQHEYRVVSLGLHPSIALYNGFYTLDGYHSMYPLEHKRRFRRIIAGELARDDTVRRYFDEWGARCYLFSAELGKTAMFTKEGKKHTLRELRIDSSAMLRLNAPYLLSAVELRQPKRSGLRLHRVFRHRDALWDIYLYEAVRGRAPT